MRDGALDRDNEMTDVNAFQRNANYDLERLGIWNMAKKFWDDNRSYFSKYTPMTDITDAPTYEGQAPFIGDPPPQHPELFRLLPHLQNAHIPTNDSSSEHHAK
ncbi:protein doublesex-like isoform X4 [Vespula maculifrons]|uniref:Protein doublesex-like isoform X4 n=1 Tax=Vespula maculifrons TaxID=7453 RepID=A0ABD2BCS0_VESMC